MGILLIVLAIIVIGLIFIGLSYYYIHSDIVVDLGIGLTSVGIVAMVLIILALIFVNVTKEAEVSEYREIYKSLYYQATSDIYNNLTDNGKAQLAEKITEWNSELAKNKKFKKSFWTNIFYPIDYNQFQFIPIELIKKEGK